jgi:hypothetical protein
LGEDASEHGFIAAADRSIERRAQGGVITGDHALEAEMLGMCVVDMHEDRNALHCDRWKTWVLVDARLDLAAELGRDVEGVRQLDLDTVSIDPKRPSQHAEQLVALLTEDHDDEDPERGIEDHEMRPLPSRSNGGSYQTTVESSRPIAKALATRRWSAGIRGSLAAFSGISKPIDSSP